MGQLNFIDVQMIKCGKGGLPYSVAALLVFPNKKHSQGRNHRPDLPPTPVLPIRDLLSHSNNWKRIFKILLRVNMVSACMLLRGVLNTSGVRAAPGTLKHAVWVGTGTL